MLASGTATLERAHREGWAIPAFSVYGLEQSLGIVRAAVEAEAPVLLQAGSGAFKYAGEGPLAALALAIAEETPACIGVHLDHATDEDELRRCLTRGYTSVMFDGSSLPFDENVRRTAAVAEAAHLEGAWVEGELAGFSGDEEESIPGAIASALTDPAQAERFVALTGVDALAVAIGNVHGMSEAAPRLDLERLAAIRARVGVPLVLHGASGLPAADVRAAIDQGVAKLNVNTELRRAARAAVIATGGDPPASDSYPSIFTPVIEATRVAARRVCDQVGATGRWRPVGSVSAGTR